MNKMNTWPTNEEEESNVTVVLDPQTRSAVLPRRDHGHSDYTGQEPGALIHSRPDTMVAVVPATKG